MRYTVIAFYVGEQVPATYDIIYGFNAQTRAMRESNDPNIDAVYVYDNLTHKLYDLHAFNVMLAARYPAES